MTARCSNGWPLCLISRGTSHREDNSITHLSRALHSPTTTGIRLSSQLRARGTNTNRESKLKVGRGWTNGKVWFMNTSSAPVFSLPASMLWGTQCLFLWGNVCIVPLSFCLSLSCTQTQWERRALLCLYVTPPLLPLLSLSPEIYLCWLFKRPSGCHLDRVDGPNCI